MKLVLIELSEESTICFTGIGVRTLYADELFPGGDYTVRMALDSDTRFAKVWLDPARDSVRSRDEMNSKAPSKYVQLIPLNNCRSFVLSK